ncbi:MAG: ABC transporter permease, partial [Clostridiales bacterium]|nr:ABC transporter permease [Clostridiales bacterium]
MFIITNALKNLRRHARKSVLYFLICVIAVLTLQIYMAGIDRTEKQLRQLPDAMPISASVSSLDGAKFEGLQIKEKTVDGLLQSTYVRDLRMTALISGGIGNRAPGGLGSLTPEEAKTYYANWAVLGANTMAAVNGFEPDAVTWLPGYGPDFVSGSEEVCVIDKNLMETHNLTLGDSVHTELHWYSYDNFGQITLKPLELAKLRIVGSVDMGGAPQRLVVPFEYIRTVFHRKELEFTGASASFYVRDALKLNDFKAEMKTLQLFKVDTSGNAALVVLANKGTALLVNDATFISAATRLQETLALLRGFMPLLAAVLAGIGYFVAYLMIQNRREEYAVLRLLGMSRSNCMGLYLTEIAALTLGGSLFGALISAAVDIGSISSGVLAFSLLSLCFMLGSII